ncbi:DUF2793 domain-containing protein [Terrihabitans sp. B22-R8]|uniref:DUF2793 domain-containing protein n=1 Tax=Terrihabitans sp. B22-R8 TaxID=3425128 RepID=UPI00403CFCEF
MSETTANLGLPLIAAAQAQKHVPVNEALTRLDLLVQACVLDRDQSVPPDAPIPEESHIVASGASGAWTGRDNAVAVFRDGDWLFLTPREGWRCWVAKEGVLCVFSIGEWSAAGGGENLQNISLFGFRTEADEATPFAVKAENALWTAKAGEEGGNGDLRVVMNKEASGNVVSLLMQSGYVGRAEIGLVGDDDLLFKVSADDGEWREAIRIDRGTGEVRFPQGGVRERFTSDRGFFVRTDGDDGNDGTADSPERAFATLQHAYDVIARRYDLAGFTAVITLGEGIFAGLNVASGWTGGGTFVVQGAGAGATVLSAGAHLIAWSVPLPGDVQLSGMRLTTTGEGDCLRGDAPGVIRFRDVDFAGCAGRHVAMTAPGARAMASGDYRISGGAVRHWSADAGASISVQGKALMLAGSPAFTSFAEAINGGTLIVNGNSFSGAASGARYLVAANAVIRAGAGSGYLPGSGLGSAQAGGQYL